MISPEDRIAAWVVQIESAIAPEVIRMHHHKAVWDRVAAMLGDNAEALPESSWWAYMFETYSVTQALAIRRLADVRKDSSSLLRLLMDLRKHARVLEQDWWVETLWKPAGEHDRWYATSQWSENFGRTVGTHLDPALPANDAARLVNAASNVKQYVDENVAHLSRDKRDPLFVLELREVHQAIATVDEIFRRYISLLTASSYATTTPIEQGDFYAPFRVAWMRPGYVPDDNPFS